MERMQNTSFCRDLLRGISLQLKSSNFLLFFYSYYYYEVSHYFFILIIIIIIKLIIWVGNQTIFFLHLLLYKRVFLLICSVYQYYTVKFSHLATHFARRHGCPPHIRRSYIMALNSLCIYILKIL